MNQTWMIYGANGTVAQHILAFARTLSLKPPILAGRDEVSIRTQAKESQLACQIFSLKEKSIIIENLKNVRTILYCASAPTKEFVNLLHACEATRTNYLGINSRYSEIKAIYRREKKFKQANIVAIPGINAELIGFEMIASSLKEKIPNATHMKLGVELRPMLTHGHIMSLLEHISLPSLVIAHGVIKRKQQPFFITPPLSGLPKVGLSTYSPSVLTCWKSTRIPHVESFYGIHDNLLNLIRKVHRLRWFLEFEYLKKIYAHYLVSELSLKNNETMFLQKDSQSSELQKLHFWGKATNPQGASMEIKLELENPLLFLVKKVLSILIQSENSKARGVLTPHRALLFLDQPHTMGQ